MKIERVSTGIPGLDDLMEGGIPRGGAVLVTGVPGCAKTTFGLQFIVKGAMESGEKGVFISLEEKITQLAKQFMIYGYDILKMQEEGKILLIHPEINIEEGEDLLKIITGDEFMGKISEFGARMIAIDPLNLVTQFSRGYGGERRSVERLIHAYKNLDCTTLFTHERACGGEDITYGVQDFVVDGIIYLQLIRREVPFENRMAFFDRKLSILKMRETDHGQGFYPLRIEKDGIHIYQ